jgi:hypothetical protein
MRAIEHPEPKSEPGEDLARAGVPGDFAPLCETTWAWIQMSSIAPTSSVTCNFGGDLAAYKGLPRRQGGQSLLFAASVEFVARRNTLTKIDRASTPAGQNQNGGAASRQAHGHAILATA